MKTAKLAHILRDLRKRHRLSTNRLAKLSGLSRRTLARLEAGQWAPLHPERSRRASRTAMRLVKLLLPPDEIDAILTDASRLSRGYAAQLGGAPDDYRLLDLLPDPYPYFLFHPPRSVMDRLIRQEFAPDYRASLFQLVLRPPRNLGLRLRAFRLRHDLTLVETASLLGLSKSELHRIERCQRHPSAPTAFKILRLLTSPSPAHVGEACLPQAGPCPSRILGGSPVTSHQLPVTRESLDPLDPLRHLWLSGRYKTRELAAALGISQPHLIRLLRGDRRPSKGLLERIALLASRN